MIARVALDEGARTGSIRKGVTFPEGDWRRHRRAKNFYS